MHTTNKDIYHVFKEVNVRTGIVGFWHESGSLNLFSNFTFNFGSLNYNYYFAQSV